MPLRADGVRRQIAEGTNFESLVYDAIRKEQEEDLDVVLYRSQAA